MKTALRWEALNPDEWEFGTEFGNLMVISRDDCFFAYWAWDEIFEIGYFHTLDEAKEACMKDLEGRVAPVLKDMGFKEPVKKYLQWKELGPDEWILETDLCCLRVDDGEDYHFEPSDEGKFRAYWDCEDAIELGWFDTIDEAKEACMKGLEKCMKPFATFFGWVCNRENGKEN